MEIKITEFRTFEEIEQFAKHFNMDLIWKGDVLIGKERQSSGIFRKPVM